MPRPLIKPTMLHTCRCGGTLQESIKDQRLICECGHSLDNQDRVEIELLSRTLYGLLEDLGIEGAIVGQTLFELDEVCSPNGLLPVFIQAAMDAAQTASPGTHYLFDIVEIADISDDSDTPFCAATHHAIEINKASTMPQQVALVIMTNLIHALVRFNRTDDPRASYLNHIMPMSFAQLAQQVA